MATLAVLADYSVLPFSPSTHTTIWTRRFGQFSENHCKNSVRSKKRYNIFSFSRFIQLVSMLYYCRNIIALCALKKNITLNVDRPHCAAALILILLWHSKKWQDSISKHRIAQRRHFDLMLYDFFFTSRNAGLHSRLLCSVSHPLGWFTFRNKHV